MRYDSSSYNSCASGLADSKYGQPPIIQRQWPRVSRAISPKRNSIEREKGPEVPVATPWLQRNDHQPPLEPLKTLSRCRSPSDNRHLRFLAFSTAIHEPFLFHILVDVPPRHRSTGILHRDQENDLHM